MTQFSTFKDAILPTIEQAGGKGLSLIHMEKKGFNVPPAVVLSATFFEAWMEQLKAAPEWRTFTQSKGDGMAAASTAVKKFCRTLVFSAEQ